MDTLRPRAWFALLGLAAAVLTGCSTPSINPIYSDDQSEVVTDDRVIGAWMEAVDEGKEPKKTRYEVQKRSDEKTNWYPVKVTGESADKSGSYELRLVKLGAHTYADLFPDRSERDRLGERLALSALPMHVIFPTTISDDSITLRPLDGAKVKALVEQTPKVTPHCIRDDLVILTGDFRQVQEFFRKVVETEDMFGKSIELVRGQAADPTGAVVVPDNARNRSGRTPSRPRPRN
jgi:hypothetical protein